MKMFIIIYDVTNDDDVMETLSNCCVSGYTKWSKALGKGKRSDPKMDDAVWPGYNCAVMMAVDEDLESEVYNALLKLHKKTGKKALKVFGWPIEQLI